MLHEYREEITALKTSNAHFVKIFDRHNEIDEIVNASEKGEKPMTDIELENLKKEKLKLKDEAYAIIVKYKKDNA